VAIVVITICTLCQLAAPYWDWRVSALDFICCLSISFNCVALLYYNNADFAKPNEFSAEQDGAVRLDQILTAVNAINMALIVALFALTYIEVKFKKWSIKTLSRAIAHLAVRVQKGISENRDAFFKTLHISSSENEHDSEHVKLDAFVAAAMTCYDGTDTAPSKEAVQSLFYILKLVQGDENPHSLWMSQEMRKFLASSDRGVRKSLVRALGCFALWESRFLILLQPPCMQLREAFGDEKLGASELKRLTIKPSLKRSLTLRKSNDVLDADDLKLNHHWDPSLIYFVSRKICW
jgi:hypothetical protein